MSQLKSVEWREHYHFKAGGVPLVPFSSSSLSASQPYRFILVLFPRKSSLKCNLIMKEDCMIVFRGTERRALSAVKILATCLKQATEQKLARFIAAPILEHKVPTHSPFSLCRPKTGRGALKSPFSIEFLYKLVSDFKT